MELQHQLRLRKDLVFSRQETAAGPVFVVKDPASGRFFHFRELEGFIAQQLDGETPPDVVHRRVEEKFGTPLPADALSQFGQRLSQLGLLDGAGVSPRTAAPRRVRGNLLYLRLRAFDPDRLLTRLSRHFGFFFTRRFAVLSALLVAFAGAVAWVHGEAMLRELVRHPRAEFLLAAYLLFLLTGGMHELAHGVACKRFGGEVREMGFMLIYFQPALYCNVSDAWLFREKSHRLWVTFAGGWFDLFLWALATLVWRLTEPGNAVHFAALVVTATSGVRTLFNLNPLIKLDGYYLLSDLLEIPNLRARSFAYVGARLRAFRRGGAAPEATARERRIYLVYGLLAAVYSTWLLSMIALHFGVSLTTRFQGLGFVLFLLLAAMLFRAPLGAVAGRLGAVVRATGGGTTSWRGPLLKAAAACVALLGAWLIPVELRVSGEFSVVPGHNADIRAEIESLVEEVFVEQGDRVAAGTLLARFYANDLHVELAKVEAQIAEAQRTQAERRGQAESVMEKARARLAYAQRELGRVRELHRRELVSAREQEAAQERVAVLERELEEAQAELRLLQAASAPAAQAGTQEVSAPRLGGGRRAIAALDAELLRLLAERQHLFDQIARAEVRSPVGGVVATARPKEKLGQLLHKGDVVMEVHELEEVTAEIAVPEQEIADVHVGQPVLLKARAYPGRSFHGKVTAIAPAVTVDEVRGTRTVPVTTRLPNPEHLLKAQMTGRAKVLAGKRSLLDLVTRRLVRYLRVEFWSWW